MTATPLQNMVFQGIPNKLTVMILNDIKTMAFFLVIILKAALLFKKSIWISN